MEVDVDNYMTEAYQLTILNYYGQRSLRIGEPDVTNKRLYEINQKDLVAYPWGSLMAEAADGSGIMRDED